MPNQNLDSLFATLADPTRRAVIERLMTGPAPVGELARPHQMALPSFMQHIEVLKSRGMIRTRKVGRQRICEMEPQALAPIEDWLGRQRRIWEARLDRLQAFVEQLEKDKP